MRAFAWRAPAVLAAALMLATGLSGCSNAAGYTWDNVVIKGGGFVPGIIFNRTEKDLIYARTDIGGAYRWWPQQKKWIPLLDQFGPDDWGLTGVVSLATDPVDPNRVYVAGGTYTNDWDPKPGAILRSSDRGSTWQMTRLPFKLGGNMPGRGMGERLVVDPHDNRVLYLGAPSGNGLWRSTDQGVTWNRVTSFTDVGNYRDTPDDPNGYGGGIQGVVWVTFDETAPAGRTTQTIYVGVADKQNPVWRSTDAGVTWKPVPNTPTGYLPHKGVMDAAGNLYIATSVSAGPYGNPTGDKQDHGQVWKLVPGRNGTADTWTDISPIPASDTSNNYFGYSGLSLDRQHPGTLMVTGYSSWWPDTRMFRSTNGGSSWTQAYEFTSYPQRSFKYTQDITSVPWLKSISTTSDAEVSPRLGWMTESLEIDPFNSNRMMYGTGATIYGTENLGAWDTGGQAKIVPMVDGLEETSVLDLISPPSGPSLISGLGDIGGFRHDSLTQVPKTTFTQPYITTTTSLDFAEARPGFVVRVGNQSVNNAEQGMIGISSDGGANWYAGNGPSGTNSGGSVAVAADGNRIVWAPGGTNVVAGGGDGSSWQPATGIPTASVVESDRVDANTFYGWNGGRFYRSTDGGRTFAATAATGLPATGVKFKARPGAKGDIWLAGKGAGLWHSTDGGNTFTKVAKVDSADNIGFGKAATGQTYPALFSSAKVNGVNGIYQSDDAGVTWVRINDDRHQYANTEQAITGDPRVYGRVYVGTNGRGIVYASRAAT